MTAGLWFSVVNLSLKHAHGIFQTLSLELKETYFAIEMSLNTAWQITEVSNSAKQKVKNRKVKCMDVMNLIYRS